MGTCCDRGKVNYFKIYLASIVFNSTFAASSETKRNTRENDSVAQLVEHYTFNVVVLGSNPSGITPIKKTAFLRMQAFFLQ
jgi:hypothetical protein